MSELSHQTRKLLELARDGDPMPAHRRARLETRFFARLAGGVVLGVAADAAWGKAVPFFGAITKGIAGVALASSLGAGGYFAVHALRSDLAMTHAVDRTHGGNAPSTRSAAATQSLAAQPAAPEANVTTPLRASSDDRREVSAKRAAPAPAQPGSRTAANSHAARVASHGPAATPSPFAGAPSPAPPAPAAAPEAPVPTAEPPAPVRPPSTLTEETRLLWEADQALRSGDANRAVSLLDEHAARYPDGSLGPERGAERIVALCKMGRTDADSVNGYLSSHPNSSFADRIQHACARILSRPKRAAR